MTKDTPMTLTPTDYAAGRKAFEAWFGKPWPTWGTSWNETVIARLVKEGRTASKDAKPTDDDFVLACNAVNTQIGSIAYRMPGAKTDLFIQFIAALLAKPTTGASAADIAAAEKRGRDQVKAAVMRAMEGL